MRLKNRLISTLLAFGMIAIVAYNALYGGSIYESHSNWLNRETIRIWYTDEALTPYIFSKAMAYTSSQKIGQRVRIEPKCVPESEFLEKINVESLNDREYPDLYVATNDVLEKAYYAGLAIECDNSDGYFSDAFFPKAALSSVKYNDKFIAYPFYFETSALVYNKTYLEDFVLEEILKERESVQQALEGDKEEESEEENSEEGEGDAEKSEEESSDDKDKEDKIDIASSQGDNAPKIAGDDSENNNEEVVATDDVMAASKENAQVDQMNEKLAEAEKDPELMAEVEQRMKEEIPTSIQDIIEFSGRYNAPDQIDVFKWDVTDIFYNYFFVGKYMDVGGENGDNAELINIYDENTISCMKIYQQLSQFFAIDASTIDYDSIVKDFADGKIVFTIATTDIFDRINEVTSNEKTNFGTAPKRKFEYGVAPIPDLTDEYGAKTMSVTDCIVVNGFSENIEEANLFAKYLCRDLSGDLYTMSGKLAAHQGVQYPIKDLETFVKVYASSVPMPKTIETSNLWMELEIAFIKIWDGSECNSTLKQVSEKIKTQVSIRKTGETYEEEYIMDPMDDALIEGLSEEGD
ncbi:MAG: sugar ABC transporter substrate-binding protein [Butyrivibrio sp.]|nr:sugar ABC transporter substrate-binding protein [Butyrivibrio sp.]